MWMRRIALIACFLGFIAALGRFVGRAREGARWSQCYGDFKGIALALHNYESAYGTLPPAYLTDTRGRPTLSWRVLILPFLENQALYDAFNLSEPWDGSANSKLLARMPSILACPTLHQETEAGRTKCVAIIGPGTMFPRANPARFSDIRDGLGGTIMLAEVANLGIPWTAPVDLDIRTMSLRVNDPRKPSISSPHAGGPVVSMGDGTLLFVPRSLAPESLSALTTVAGAEPLDAKSTLRRTSQLK